MKPRDVPSQTRTVLFQVMLLTTGPDLIGRWFMLLAIIENIKKKNVAFSWHKENLLNAGKDKYA